MPAKFEAAAGGARLNAVIVTADPATGRATAIERLNLSAADVEALAESQARGCTSLSEWPISFRSRSRKTTPDRRAAAGTGRAPRVHRQRADGGNPPDVRIRLWRRLGRGRDLELQASGTPATPTSR